MASWKQIEGARELRLWIGQIVVPGIILAGAVLSVPEVRGGVQKAVGDMKTKVKNMFHKGDAR